MSLTTILQFRALEASLAELTAKHESLAPEAKALIEFLERIKKEAAELGLNLREVAEYLAPESAKAVKQGKARKQSKPRAMKVYQNPNGERIETKGGNHKELKAWKAEHGNDVVESWRVEAA